MACWGANDQGQLGDGATKHQMCGSGMTVIDCSNTPVAVFGLADAVEVSVGHDHACARRAGGQVVCWGYNLFGQLGDGTRMSRSAPVAVQGLSDAVAISAGFASTCALRATGAVVCWGWNDNGELGDGVTSHQSCGLDCSPVPVTVAGLDGVTSLSGRWTHTCAVRGKAGGVSCWGDDRHDQLGDDMATHGSCNTGPCSSRPVAVASLTDAVLAATGTHFSCALSAGCAASCWGWNFAAQLGDGTATDRPAPVAVRGL